jgi:uncharacterized membrane protein
MSRRVPLERATSRRWPRAVAAEAGAEAVAEAGAGASDEAAAEAGERAAPPRPRIGGIDLARALAIVGMLAVHIGPTHLTDVAGRLYALPHGRASILFVLVAGIGVSLLAASRTRSLAAARWRLAWRAALLLPLGLLLQDLDHRVFVILPTYAALFLVAILALRLPDRALLALACALALLGPVAVLLGSTAYPEAFARRAAAWSDPASVPYRVFAGPFPLPVWSAPFLLGMWLGRRDLRSQATRIALVLGGAATAALAPAAASLLAGVVGRPRRRPRGTRCCIAKPHSQMPPWLIGSMGSAALVLGCSLAWPMRCRASSPRWWRWGGWRSPSTSRTCSPCTPGLRPCAPATWPAPWARSWPSRPPPRSPRPYGGGPSGSGRSRPCSTSRTG